MERVNILFFIFLKRLLSLSLSLSSLSLSLSLSLSIYIYRLIRDGEKGGGGRKREIIHLSLHCHR